MKKDASELHVFFGIPRNILKLSRIFQYAMIYSIVGNLELASFSCRALHIYFDEPRDVKRDRKRKQ